MDLILEQFARGFVLVQEKWSALVPLFTGFDSADPKNVYLLLAPFLLPLALVTFKGRILPGLSIIGALTLILGSLTTRLPLAPKEGEVFLIAYAATLLVAFGFALSLIHAGSTDRKVRQSARQLGEKLQATQLQLDQERLWRRAGGEDFESIPDDEIRALLERVSARLDTSDTSSGPRRKRSRPG